MATYGGISTIDKSEASEVDEGEDVGLEEAEGPAVELVFLDRAPPPPVDEMPLSAREPVFKPRMDRTTSFTFRRRPLGLTFTPDEAPLVIIKVGHGSEGQAA